MIEYKVVEYESRMTTGDGNNFIASGVIKDIFTKNNNGSILLEIYIGYKRPIEVEFRNTNDLKAADYVRYLHLEPGENVLIQATKKKDSDKRENFCYNYYGNKISRMGMFFLPSMSFDRIIKGTVLRFHKMSQAALIYVSYDKRKAPVPIEVPMFSKGGHFISPKGENIYLLNKLPEKGDIVSFHCWDSSLISCNLICHAWSYEKCKSCSRKTKIVKYAAFSTLYDYMQVFDN